MWVRFSFVLDTNILSVGKNCCHLFCHLLFEKLPPVSIFVAKQTHMQVNFYLSSNKRKAALIYCNCTFEHKRMRFSTGKNVSPSCWMDKRQRVEGASSLNAYLQHVEDTCHAEYNDMVKAGAVEPSALKERVLAKLSGKPADGYLLPYYEAWSNTKTPTRTPNAQGRLSYRKIAEYAKPKIKFSEVTAKWIEGYVMYLESKGYTINYIGTQVKNLKAVMSRALDDGLHSNTDYKKAKRMEEDSDAVYLTKEEIAKLEDCVLFTPREKATRDLFLVGYYTAMRFSDYSRLSMNDIVDGRLKVCTMKTGEQVVIPANPKLVAILQRYGGRVPRLDQSDFNETIKVVCREAGIDDIVPHTITKGGRKTTDYAPKYALVTSHTARRSGATNMYLSGIKEEMIMMITGHRTYSSFRKYIRITKEENADMLSSNEFFLG